MIAMRCGAFFWRCESSCVRGAQ